MMLSGKTAFISGANRGFGWEVAKQFIKNGANVVLCAREAALLHEKVQQLKKIAPPQVTVHAYPADISDASAMKSLFSRIKQLDILVANAAVHGPKGSIDHIDWNEWSHAIDINLKGTVLQCRYALPLLKQATRGKIILLSGGGATKPMPYLSAYAASKAAIVRFAETLSEEYSELDINCVAPGAMNTRLLDDILLAGEEAVGNAAYQRALKQKQEGGVPLERGASLCLYLASAQSDGITGRLISAIWDPWNKLDQYKNHLEKSDIFTLRRIVPNDRQQNWGEPT